MLYLHAKYKKNLFRFPKPYPMKKIFILLVLFLSIQSQSQTYLKFNGATALVAIPNIGVETSIGEKTTFSVDVMASFWESVNGHNPMKFVTLTPEVRYHFKESEFYQGRFLDKVIYSLLKK